MEGAFIDLDLDKKGYLTKQDFLTVCSARAIGDRDRLETVFARLDEDQDGRIDARDFVNCYDWLQRQKQQQQRRQQSGAIEAGFGSFASSDDDMCDVDSTSEESSMTSFQRHLNNEMLDDFLCLFSLKSQEQLCELYQQLYDSGQTENLSRFEKVIFSVIKDVRQQQCENERLERSYKREKEEHQRHLRHLEEEMEAQMQKVETRVIKEEKERHESEKEELKNAMEAELSELQENLKVLQQFNVPVKSEKPIDEFRVRLEESLQENRLLRRQLTESQTSLALLRSEVANAKSEYEEKCYDLETEKQTLMEYVAEHENLTRQIQLLHEANKRLHDTNDDLREALESSRLINKRTGHHRPRRSSVVSNPGRSTILRSVSAGSRCEYVRRYLQDSALSSGSGQERINEDILPHEGEEGGEGGGEGGRAVVVVGGRVGVGGGGGVSAVLQEPTSLAEELTMIEGERCNSRRVLPAHDSCEVESSFAEDIDSGHFTMRDVQDDESDDDSSLLHPTKRSRQGAMRGSYRTNNESQTMESFEESEQDRDHVDCQHDDGGSTMPPSRSCSFCSHTSGRISRQSSEGTAHPGSNTASAKRGGHQTTGAQLIPKPITQEPERVFKIVLAGDAAVGKSSFIMRLCKNKFVTNLNSTLGVDFQTKTLEVDGRVIALQLWDTAGQERFRSIAKSYFRRADGVLLLYDVTYERSFISVRDWLEAIEEGAQKQIPIMLVGNKSDLRSDLLTDSTRTMVKHDEGQRLARECKGLFIETSAKEGNNIIEAVTELSRMLMTNEDLEVKTIGLKLQDSTADGMKKKSPCCNI